MKTYSGRRAPDGSVIVTRVVDSVRRVVLHLPARFPYRAEWARVALALGALP
jgi:hypothetical protein